MKNIATLTTALVLSAGLTAAFATVPSTFKPGFQRYGFSIGLAKINSTQAVTIKPIYTKAGVPVGPGWKLTQGQAHLWGKKYIKPLAIVVSAKGKAMEKFDTSNIPNMSHGYGTWLIQDKANNGRGQLVNINTGDIILADSAN